VKFTPGPWKAQAIGSEGYIVETDEPGKTINQRAYPWGLAMVSGGWNWEEIKANAQLISAAPDMYEALIQARGALRLDAMVDERGEPYGTTVEALKVINKALDKAEGKVED